MNVCVRVMQVGLAALFGLSGTIKVKSTLSAAHLFPLLRHRSFGILLITALCDKGDAIALAWEEENATRCAFAETCASRLPASDATATW